MSDYDDRLAACLWQELAVVYPDLAGRETDPEKRKQLAEQAKDELFGPDEENEEVSCLSKD